MLGYMVALTAVAERAIGRVRMCRGQRVSAGRGGRRLATVACMAIEAGSDPWWWSKRLAVLGV